jgi:hypothetical protein
MEEEMKAMKKIVDTVTREWDKLSEPSRVWVKHHLDALDVKAPVKKSDVEKERV